MLQMCEWEASCKGYSGKTNLYSCCSALVELWVVNCGSYPSKPVICVGGLFILTHEKAISMIIMELINVVWEVSRCFQPWI